MRDRLPRESPNGTHCLARVLSGVEDGEDATCRRRRPGGCRRGRPAHAAQRLRSPGPERPTPARSSMAATRSRWPGRYCGSDWSQRVTRASVGRPRSAIRSARSVRTASTSASSGRARARLVPVPADRGTEPHRPLAGEVRPLGRRPRAGGDRAALDPRDEEPAGIELAVDRLPGDRQADHGHGGVRDGGQQGGHPCGVRAHELGRGSGRHGDDHAVGGQGRAAAPGRRATRRRRARGR